MTFMKTYKYPFIIFTLIQGLHKTLASQLCGKKASLFHLPSIPNFSFPITYSAAVFFECSPCIKFLSFWSCRAKKIKYFFQSHRIRDSPLTKYPGSPAFGVNMAIVQHGKVEERDPVYIVETAEAEEVGHSGSTTSSSGNAEGNAIVEN